MFTVTIFDKSKNLFKTYKHIQTIKHFDECDGWVVKTENEILSYRFPTFCSYQLISDIGNYNINSDIVGSIDIEKEI